MSSAMFEISSARTESELSAPVRQRVLGEWATGVELSDVVGISGLIRRGQAVPIIRTAVHCGDESLDYGELFARIERGRETDRGDVAVAVRLLAAVAAQDGEPLRVRGTDGRAVVLTPRAVTAAVADRRAVAVERRWDAADPALGSADVRLVVAPWDCSHVLIELLAALADGATLVVPTAAERGDPVALSEVIRSRSVTHVVAAPEILLGLRDTGGLSTVQRWDVVGTACPPGLSGHLRTLSPEAVASFGYDLPEYAGAVARGPLDGSGRARPIPGARVLVLDDYGQPVPPGVVGEIYAGGAALAEGEGAESSRFVADPFPVDGTATRLLRTGGRGRWTSEGWLVFEDEPDHAASRRSVGRLTPAPVLA
ncbi:AMP-binding protein [Nocardia mexicana]|uniref:AMP-binding enzyme n=1 Tax=Nocardia mexicana TaxID=279262 RepID=A0A370GW84_9NOCA|nr:AMP-binding protein [Nocardia mexicana]RDI46183.1 AMP-binding enzyme [Nocardia mexicana]